jgi:hypothetical protein
MECTIGAGALQGECVSNKHLVVSCTVLLMILWVFSGEWSNSIVEAEEARLSSTQGFGGQNTTFETGATPDLARIIHE